MNKRVVVVVLAGFGLGSAALIPTGCSSRDKSSPVLSRESETSGVPDRQSLRPVSLPDLSVAAASVRTQLDERYASLEQTIAKPGNTPSELGHAYGELGKLLMVAEYRDEAEASFLNAQSLLPDDMRWPYFLGHLYRARGQTSKSAAAFEQALKLSPGDTPTLVWLGNLYLDQGRPKEAEPLFTRALSSPKHRQNGSVAALLGLGRAALAGQDYARAVQNLEEALSLDPQATIVHYLLALAYRGLGDLAKAEDHLRKRGTIEIRPPDPLMEEVDSSLRSPVAYEVRGVRALDNGDWAGAAASFRKGVELAPDEPSLRHKLGTALAMAGDTESALSQFEEVVRRSPNFAKGHYSLGLLMASSGRGQRAIAEFFAAVRCEPNYVEARLQLADALRRSGRPDQSLTQYEQVLRLDPRVMEARYGYAMALVRLERYQEARDRLSDAQTLYPGQFGFASALARLLAAAPDDRVRDGRRAMAVMQDLLSKQQRPATQDAPDQGSVDLGETMAMTLAEVGQYGEAVTWQRQAIGSAERLGRRDLVPLLAENLALYERRAPCRVPWRDGEPMELLSGR